MTEDRKAWLVVGGGIIGLLSALLAADMAVSAKPITEELRLDRMERSGGEIVAYFHVPASFAETEKHPFVSRLQRSTWLDASSKAGFSSSPWTLNETTLNGTNFWVMRVPDNESAKYVRVSHAVSIKYGVPLGRWSVPAYPWKRDWEFRSQRLSLALELTP